MKPDGIFVDDVELKLHVAAFRHYVSVLRDVDLNCCEYFVNKSEQFDCCKLTDPSV